MHFLTVFVHFGPSEMVHLDPKNGASGPQKLVISGAFGPQKLVIFWCILTSEMVHFDLKIGAF